MSITLGDLLHSRAQQVPETSALICRDKAMSYAELNTSTDALARWFVQQGLQPGDRVALHWPNAIEAVQLYFAMFKAGLIAVPVNLRLKPSELAYVMKHSGASMCFSHPMLAQVAKEAGIANPRTELPVAGPGDEQLPAVSPDTPAAILYTSGSTGRPKGAIHTHRSLLEAARLCTEDFIKKHHKPGTAERGLVMTPVMHASGLYCLFGTMRVGQSAVLLPVFEAGAVLDAIQQHRCTVTLGLPAMMQFVVAEQLRQPRDVSSLKMVFAGGDSVPVALQERVRDLLGALMVEGLAQTETGPAITNPLDAPRPGSIGKALSGLEVRLVSLEGADVPDNETGELLVRSPANCVGYWNDAEASAGAFMDGWFYTGDLISRDAEGYHWFRGRKKEIIVRGGSNISPQEVEEELYRHPDILEAGVVGAKDPVWGEQVVAFVSLREGSSADESRIREFARQSLADYKVPSRVLFLPALPKGPTGKVHRRELKEKLIAEPELVFVKPAVA